MHAISEIEDVGFDPEESWRGSQSAEDLWEGFKEFTPKVTPHGLIWAIEHLANNLGTAYDHELYPHLGAPGGPWDAFDARWCRTISLMFGSRLAKTFFAQCCSLFVAANMAAPMMHCNATETLATDVLSRTYSMIRQRDELRGLMASRHEKDWNQRLMRFRACELVAAWAGSVSTLADKDVKFGHAGEIDKWEQAASSKEGDPLKLFDDRFKNWMSVRKAVYEGTTTLRGISRIEDRYLSGSQCSLQVPCPHCKRFQALEKGSEQSTYGLKFDRSASGRSDPAVARETARYVCRHCHQDTFDHHRGWMIRRGVWVPAGCEADDAVALAIAEQRMRPASIAQEPMWLGWKHSPWIKGAPRRDGPDQSYRLSSLYALTLSWGDIASEFLTCQDKPQLLRNFVNQWLAESWEPRKSKSTPEKIAERIGTNRPAMAVPLWGRFLTVTIDRQGADGGFVVFVVEAHGPEDRSAVIHHGKLATLDESWEQVIRHEYQHEDGGLPLVPVVAGIDSGAFTKDTYDFVNAHPGCFALKGSDSDLQGNPYKIAQLGDSGGRVKSGAVGQILIHVNTDYWETDLQHRLDDKLSGQALKSDISEPGSLELSAEASGDWEFIGQLLNATLTDKVDTRGNARLLWIKKDENSPNDYRDATRYGLCLAKAWLDGQRGVMPVHRSAATPPQQPQRKTAFTTPEGRPYLITER